MLCLQPCYLFDQPLVATFDFIANISVPIAIITLANGILIGRIFCQKRRWQQILSRHRKLTIQLLSVACLYIIFWAPLTINGLIYTFSQSELSLYLQDNYFLFLPSVVVMLLPLATLLLLPDVRKVLFTKRQITVAPKNTPMKKETKKDTHF